jgi:pimeloyl-ACP methyl ester carboxylesterase
MDMQLCLSSITMVSKLTYPEENVATRRQMMSNTETTSRSATLRIVMDRNFEDFDQEARDGFLLGLSTISGCPVGQMRQVRFRRGCVIAEIIMPEEAVQAFIEAYKNANGGTLPATFAHVLKYLRDEHIQNVNAKFEVALVIKNEKKEKSALVFVHGWTGDRTTFGKIPEYLKTRIDCDAFVYEYPTNWLKHSPAIYFVAQNLDNWFRNNIHSEKVAVIVHSMGGIVVRKFLVLQRYKSHPLDKLIKQVTFIASPHDGAPLASIAAKIPGLGSHQIQELSPNSGFISELKDAWYEWHEKMVPNLCHARCIYGTADDVVSPANAKGLDKDAVPMLGADHTNILKPASKDEEIILTLSRFLRDAGFSSTSVQRSTSEKPYQ